MKNNNTITVLTFGTFDLLHPGHISYLTYAKKYGNRLVVIIARDSSVKKIKGSSPLFFEKDRQRMVAALKIVDAAILGDTKDYYKSIEKVQPDVICLGHDHKITKNNLLMELEKRNISLPKKVIRAREYQIKKYKSSLLKKKIQTLM